ncbi:AAA family ATPase [Mycobacterium syngnathidarum]
MLTRLERIKASGIFENFSWDAELPDLARINVIFGPNGTGKTSLAGALDGLRHAVDGQGFKRVSVTLDDAAGTRTTSFNMDAAFARIHVFSEHYVDRSLRFTPAAAEMDAVLTIGERPVDAEEQLESLREFVQVKSAERESAAESEHGAKQKVDAAYRQISQSVVDAASRAGGRWHSKSNFSVTVVKTAFAKSHDSWAELKESDLHEKIALINSDKAERLPESNLRVSVRADLREQLSNALSASPTAIVLDTLAAHPEATSWVDAGRRLHHDVNSCYFCGSNLTDERRALIDQHFSDEVEKLQKTLMDISCELDKISQDVDIAVAAIPARGLFFEDLRSRADSAAESLRSELAALQEWAAAAKACADAKAANVLGTVSVAVEPVPTVRGAEFVSLRNEHNARVDGHETVVKDAAEAVERHYLKLAESVVEEQSALAAGKTAEVAALDVELQECRERIAALESIEGDPMPSAKVLTEEVARLLGRSELKFEAIDGRYRVSRFGEPAIGLSAGERTAISLVHFLESVAKFDESNGKPIVVIDDPVSSLDSDIFMGVSTYIWAETVVNNHIDQLILLTHNFELFRQWDIQVDGLHQGKDKETGLSFKKLYPAQFYEIRSHRVISGGHTKRQPVLIPWPPSEKSRRKVRSSYHHAFICVADALRNLGENDSLENRLDAQLLFPNVVRRMLETFLAFKRPEWVGDFNNAMRNSADLLVQAGYRGDANALRLRLTRYAHAHSHDEDPSTDKTINPDEVATAISAVFEFMNLLDRPHFTGLCSTVGIEPNELLPPSPPDLQDASEPPV